MDAKPLEEAQISPGFSTERMPEGARIPLVNIDSLVEDGTIERVDFIKMDIEGAELGALKGAARSIKRFMPKLAISIYHKPRDMVEIPLYIHDLGLGYRLFIDHYTIFDGETVVFALPPAAP